LLSFNLYEISIYGGEFYINYLQAIDIIYVHYTFSMSIFFGVAKANLVL